jgi:hypothetical protein
MDVPFFCFALKHFAQLLIETRLTRMKLGMMAKRNHMVVSTQAPFEDLLLGQCQCQKHNNNLVQLASPLNDNPLQLPWHTGSAAALLLVISTTKHLPSYALAPATISRISPVILACRFLLNNWVKFFLRSLALSLALFMAFIRLASSEAMDSCKSPMYIFELWCNLT